MGARRASRRTRHVESSARRAESAAALVIALAAAQGCDSFDATPAIATMRPAAIEAHLRFLADDALLGRETGGEGAVVAAEYIAIQFAASGLEPAGNNASYLQSVPIIAAMPAARLALRARGGAALSPRADVDYVAWTSLPVDSAATAGELVFVGHGISAPDWGRDDYKGADVADAVVLILGSEPRSAARAEGLTVVSDRSRPAELYRSDHIAFLRAGVPAALIGHGLDFIGRMPGWGEEMLAAFVAERLHGAEDEYGPDLDYAGAVQQGRFTLRLAMKLATARERPSLR